MGKVSRIFAGFLALIFVMALLALPLFGASVALVAVGLIAVLVLTLYSLSSRRNRCATQLNAAQVFRQQLGSPQSSKSAVRNRGFCSSVAESRHASRWEPLARNLANCCINRMSMESNLTYARATLECHVQNLLLGHRPRDQSYGFQIRHLSNRYRESTGLCPG